MSYSSVSGIAGTNEKRSRDDISSFDEGQSNVLTADAQFSDLEIQCRSLETHFGGGPVQPGDQALGFPRHPQNVILVRRLEARAPGLLASGSSSGTLIRKAAAAVPARETDRPLDEVLQARARCPATTSECAQRLGLPLQRKVVTGLLEKELHFGRRPLRAC
jgi:hypothetical protein